MSTVITVALVVSVIRLISTLPSRHLSAPVLLRSAGSLYFTNVLVFALWYWRLDAGGPHGRDSRPSHVGGAFLFPQMTADTQIMRATGQGMWSPDFVDYLFLAFNTSTALSPADTPPSRDGQRC